MSVQLAPAPMCAGGINSAEGMRLCVDGRLLGEGTGVHQYSSTLLQVLRSGGVNPLTMEFEPRSVARGPSTGLARLRRWSGALRGRPRVVASPVGRDAALRLAGGELYREARVHFRVFDRLMPLKVYGPPGVMHWTFPVPLYVEGWRNLYTVHDTIPLQGSGLSTIPAKQYHRLLRRVVARADRILTVSETARDDIVAATRCDARLVVNAYQAVDALKDADALAPSGLASGSYFIFCGRIEPRKNLERLVAAYRQSGSSRPLVIIGPVGADGERVRRAIAQVPGVRVLPFLDRPTLLRYVRHARALLFPSLAEGFGLPVAEAMALGTPVMASSISVLREVAGEAALFVNPLDVPRMSQAIASLSNDDVLCDRLGTLGLSRSTLFSHTPYFNRLMSIYTEAAERTGAGRLAA